MFWDIITLLAGLVLIIAGGNYLTDGAESLARRFKITTIVIGVTVVAFGSSAPDFVVCLTSTLSHKSQLAIGDIVGANIFDLLLAVGVMCVVTKITVDKNVGTMQLPLLFLSSLALFFCSDDLLLDGTPDFISRSDGLMLLSLFAIFMALTLRMSKGSECPQPAVATKNAAEGNQDPTPWDQAVTRIHKATGRIQNLLLKFVKKPVHTITIPAAELPKKTAAPLKIWVCVVYILGGLGALIVGGNWIVDGASAVGLKLGMSESLVGLTIVGIGSSVPDLATSLIAAMKRQTGIALGNIVGACVFNIFFIIGFCSTIYPLQAGTINIVDFLTLVGASLMLWIFGGMTKSRTINRWEGTFLILCYCGYVAYLIACK